MTMLYKLGISIAIIVIAALSSFFYGRVYEREAALKQAVQAYSQASEIQNEVNSYSDYALCLAIGGGTSSAKFSCAGWSKPPKINEPARLIENEPLLTKWVLSTNRFGQKQGCW